MRLLTTKFKSILDFYIDSSFHVSLCAVSYILLIYNQTYLTIATTDSILYNLLFVFSATYFGYNFIKFYETSLSKSKPINVNTLIFFAPSLISLFISIYLFFNFPLIKRLIVILISFFTVAYTIPFYKKFTFRSNPILKIFSISISWTLSIVYLPFYEIFDFYYLTYYSFIIFILVSVQMIPFEIRDAITDANFTKNSVNIFGVNKVKRYGYLLLLLALTLLVIWPLTHDNFKIEFSSLIILFFMIIIIRISKKNQFKYFSSLFVESIPMYWLIFDLLL